jgi:hypothetical protein
MKMHGPGNIKLIKIINNCYEEVAKILQDIDLNLTEIKHLI